MVSLRSSRRQATVHRTVAFNRFESPSAPKRKDHNIILFYNPDGHMPTSLRMRSHGHGFSHGLKIARPLSIFAPVYALVPPFRIPSHPLPKRKDHTVWCGLSFWQRMRDSNPRKRSQSPVCYRYTNPLNATTLLYAILFKSQALFAMFVILFLFFLRLPREGLPLQDTFPQVGKGLVLTFIPQHGQKIGQLLQGSRMQQVLLKAAVEVV